MTREVLEQQLTQCLDRRPFRSFAVELVEGQRLDVDDPLALAMRDGTFVFIAPACVPVRFASECVRRVSEI